LHWRTVIALGAAGLACSTGWPAVPAQNKTSADHKPVAPSAKKETVPARRAHGAKNAPARSSWHPGQTAPTAERYKEIQEALAKKGYLHGEASGVWDQNSMDALRRFQQDQSLQASGKLDSLSIIALGLGPKH